MPTSPLPDTAALSARVVRSRHSGDLEPSNRMLKVGGITPYTLHDFPGKAAAVVFVQGCPWQCGYCHNPHLQTRMPKSPLAWPRMLKLLEERQRIIQAVVFSGGEPTTDPGLFNAVCDARALGLLVGMHTGGADPERLQSVLPMLDWIALDIKAPFDRYEKVTGAPGSGADVRRSAQAILASEVAHEFRTTLHPLLLEDSDLARIGQDLLELGARNLVLQPFRPQGCRNKSLRNASVENYPSAGVLESLAGMLPEFRFQEA